MIDKPSRSALCSTWLLSWSGSRRLIRAVAPSPDADAEGPALEVHPLLGSGFSACSPAVSAGERDHELGLAAAQAQLDRARRQLAGDLGGCRRERIQEGESHGGFQRGREPLRERQRVLATGRRRDRELLAELVYVRF